MEFEGKVIQELPIQEGISARTGNPWKKKEWILETFGNYPRKVKVQAFGDRAASLNLELGQSYKVSVDAESREFNGRWYTDLSVYAASPCQAPVAPGYPAAPAAPAAGPQFAPTSDFGVAPSAGSAEDDLPF